MLRRLLHIVILLLLPARLLYAHTAVPGGCPTAVKPAKKPDLPVITIVANIDTNKLKRPQQNHMDILDHSTIKEVPKTKRQPKPEKVVTPVDTTSNNKPRSKRRPDGVERPPDIIRRNNN